MSRLEIIGRGVLVIGLLVGLGAAGVIFGRQIFESPPEAPATEELGPLLNESTVVLDVPREDLSADRGGRSVLLSVPQAFDQGEAVRVLLLTLRDAGWLVSGRGGAVSRDGDVCLVLSTPTSWLADDANEELRDDIQAAQDRTSNTTVVADMFFCSDAERQ